MSRKVTEFTLAIHVVALVVLLFLYMTGLWFSQSFEPTVGLALFGVFSMDAIFLFTGLSAVIPYLALGVGVVPLIILGFVLPLINPSTTDFGMFLLTHPILTIAYVVITAVGLIVYRQYLGQIEEEVR